MPRLVLNALQVRFDPPICPAHARPFHTTDEVRELRATLGDEWFFNYNQEQIFALPRVPEPSRPFGQPCTLKLEDHPYLLRAMLEEALPSRFNHYKPLYLRPLTIASEREEDILSPRAQELKLAHPLLTHFTVRSKLEIEPRVIAPGGRDRQVALFFTLSSRWEISANLEDLAAAGVDLHGLVVVRAEHKMGERRALGRINKIEGGRVHLSEGFDAAEPVPVEEARLEGRKDAFERCLGRLLGAGAWRALERSVQERADADLGGPMQRARLEPIATYLRKRPLALAGGISATVGDEVSVPVGEGSAVLTPRIEYCFDASKQKRDLDNWAGLRRFGPMTRDTLRQQAPRIMVFCDADEKIRVEQFFRKLREGIETRQRVFDAGFGPIYHLADVRFTVNPITLARTQDPQIAARYRAEAIRAINPDAKPAAAFVVINDRVADLPEPINPYWNVRAGLMMMGVPVQAIRLSKLGKPDHEAQYVLQNLSIALYAKLEGTPWTIAHDQTLNDELVIGLGVAEIRSSRFGDRERVVGVTTVFGGDGRYRVGTLTPESSYRDYPDVLRATTLDVLQRERRRNGWQAGDRVRVVFHAWQPLRKVDVARIVAEATETVGADLALEFAVLTVSRDHPMRVFDLDQRGMRVRDGVKGAEAPDRGVILRVSEDEHLVCTQGPAQVKSACQPLPDPLLVKLHRQHRLERTDLWYLSEQVLKFTSLSWKSRFPAALPATIYYSKLIADQLGRLQLVPDWSTMTLKQMLSESKWFL